ncbi:MAG TPA: hypothetical protein VGQ39_02395 [Pyrinomonadaceae bacterium]|nr:hypothetical protein [Pyrinomonadaceae bacterium]
MPISFRLQRIVLLLLTFLAPVLVVQAQCTQKLTDLPAAPELLGFRLGMTKDEVKARVPQTVFGRTDDFGVSKTTINPSFDPRIDKTKFEAVRTISLDMVDERLTSLWIGYDETFKIQKVDEFVKLVSESLKVSGAWSQWRGRGQQLKCADFQLIVSTIAGGPSLRVLDVGAEDVVAARRQAKEERDSAIEAAAADEATVEIVGDKQNRVYYLANCTAPKEIAETNKVSFKTVEEAEKAGFKLAKGCH